MCKIEDCKEELYCKEMCKLHYFKTYYQEHKQRYRDYDKANKEQRRIQTRENNQKRRREAIEALGGKCVKCGFTDWRALQIDHVHGGGWVEYRELGSRWKMQEKALADTEGNYQLLCANCNWIKRYENGEHTGYLDKSKQEVVN